MKKSLYLLCFTLVFLTAWNYRDGQKGKFVDVAGIDSLTKPGDNFFRFRLGRPQFIENHNLDPAHIIHRTICDETWLHVTDRDGKIGDYAVAICFA